MQKILYLAQRIPFPPDKGDKITTFNILKYLATRADVYLAAFADDSADMVHVEKLREFCKDVLIVSLEPKAAKVRALPKLLNGEALTLGYFHDSRIADWVDKTVAREGITKALIYSSAMAQYVQGPKYQHMTRLGHFADIDSDKWAQYAKMSSGIKRWVYAREARTLESFEISIAREFNVVSFVAPFEAEHFKGLAPDTSSRIKVIQNGTDVEYFCSSHDLENPYASNVYPIVFTGAMDYLPNSDAVNWFAKDIFPIIRQQIPNAMFYIVGSKPGDEVKVLEKLENVKVTGRVPDVRPYLKFGSVAVAPMRAARGVQNKALEAMAMGLEVVCTAEVKRGLSDESAQLVHAEATETAFAFRIVEILKARKPMATAQSNRAAIVNEYSWEANLQPIVDLLKLS
jgi:sugar transferase (PEP-CTERM/EpsH1 system associated)